MTSDQLFEVLMKRDHLSRSDAEEAVNWAREQVAAGADPEKILMEQFRLEPDWVIDLITY
jgi:nucleoid DNA-binding protein